MRKDKRQKYKDKSKSKKGKSFLKDKRQKAKDKSMDQVKRQDRAFKICPVGKFSEGDSMQGWIKTKVLLKISVHVED